jgi:hypothetical protein
MKLPAIIIRRGPAAKIEAAQVLLTAAETRIGQLTTERKAALVGDSVEEVISQQRLGGDAGMSLSPAGAMRARRCLCSHHPQ